MMNYDHQLGELHGGCALLCRCRRVCRPKEDSLWMRLTAVYIFVSMLHCFTTELRLSRPVSVQYPSIQLVLGGMRPELLVVENVITYRDTGQDMSTA
jgi:hypothetical protein